MIEIPAALAETQRAEDGAWVRNLPALAAEMLDRWSLRLDGPVGHGMAGIVLPVVRADGLAAVLKLQPVTEESKDVATGLRTWAGRGTVLLLDHDERTGAMLLERLDAARPLATVADDTAALEILAGLLARLTAVAAPPGVRHLADIAAAMLDQVPSAVPALKDPAEQALVRDCAAATAEVLPEPGRPPAALGPALRQHPRRRPGTVAGNRPGASRRRPWLRPAPCAGQPLGRHPGHQQRREGSPAPLRPTDGSPVPGPRPRHGLDPGKSPTKLLVGHRRRQTHPGTGTDHHRPSTRESRSQTPRVPRSDTLSCGVPERGTREF